MEEAVSDLGFASVDILQPSLLLGPRKTLRPLEITGRIFAPLINPLLTGPREAYRAIPAETVAKAMLGAARRGAAWRLPLHLWWNPPAVGDPPVAADRGANGQKEARLRAVPPQP